MSTKNVVRTAIIAALYAVLTIALAPASFGPIQFRVSEILKVFVLFDPFMAFGIGLGTLMANFFSPMAGPWELIWMPFTDIVGGLIAYFIYQALRRKLWIIPMLGYAITTGLAVGLMLSFFGFGLWYIAALPVIASEAVLLIIGAPIIIRIKDTLKLKGVFLEKEKYPN